VWTVTGSAHAHIVGHAKQLLPIAQALLRQSWPASPEIGLRESSGIGGDTDKKASTTGQMQFFELGQVL